MVIFAYPKYQWQQGMDILISNIWIQRYTIQCTIQCTQCSQQYIGNSIGNSILVIGYNRYSQQQFKTVPMHNHPPNTLKHSVSLKNVENYPNQHYAQSYTQSQLSSQHPSRQSQYQHQHQYMSQYSSSVHQSQYNIANTQQYEEYEQDQQQDMYEEDDCHNQDFEQFVHGATRIRKPYATRSIAIRPSYMNMSMNVNMNMDTSRNVNMNMDTSRNVNMNMDTSRNGHDGHMGYDRHVVNLSNKVVMESMKESRKQIKLKSNKKKNTSKTIQKQEQHKPMQKLKIKQIKQTKSIDMINKYQDRIHNTNNKDNSKNMNSVNNKNNKDKDNKDKDNKDKDKDNKDKDKDREVGIMEDSITDKKCSNGSKNKKMMSYTTPISLVIPSAMQQSNCSAVKQQNSHKEKQPCQQQSVNNNNEKPVSNQSTIPSSNYQTKTNTTQTQHITQPQPQTYQQTNQPNPLIPQPQSHQQPRPQIQPVPLTSTQNIQQQNPTNPSNTNTTNIQQPSSKVSAQHPHVPASNAGLIDQSYLNKIMSEMMLQNNQYLHRVNESVVNRLLNIIQNNGSFQNGSTGSFNSSMKSSQLKPYYQSNTKLPYHNKHHNKSKSHQLIDQTYNQPTPTPTPTQQNMLTTNHAQMISQASVSLDSTLKQQQIDISVLQNKRNNRRHRQFTNNRNVKSKYSEDICNQNNLEYYGRQSVQLDSQAETPRPQQQQQILNFMSTSNKMLPTPSPIQHLEFQSQLHTHNVTPSVSHHTSFCSNFCQAKTSNNINHTNGFEKKKDKIQVYQQNKQKDNQIEKLEKNQKVQIIDRKPVFMEIGKGEDEKLQGAGISLAQAFKRKIGKLPTKQERKAKQQQQQIKNIEIPTNTPMLKNTTLTTSQTKPRGQTIKKSKTHQIHSSKAMQIDTNILKQSSSINCSYVTPKSKQPSQQLLNRLIGGSKAKISKKEMYALTKKNYENLPQVQEKKKNQQKRMQEQMRLERIKEYQRSIRASKVTIASNNN